MLSSTEKPGGNMNY